MFIEQLFNAIDTIYSHPLNFPQPVGTVTLWDITTVFFLFWILGYIVQRLIGGNKTE